MNNRFSPTGKLSHEIPHPNDPERKMFISSDYTHLLKNLRNQFKDRIFNICSKILSFEPIVTCYNTQKRFSFLRPARKLGPKHVEPKNLERQKVCYATDISSHKLIAALQTFQEFKVEGFQNKQNIITLMKMVKKW